MTDNEVEAFLVLYECHSISRASERLYISQSALSLRIKALEEEIGAPLFLRGKGQRSVEPTQRGLDFYELAVQYNETVKKMQRLSSVDKRGRLRVCCFDSVNHYLFKPVYTDFMERCPEAVLEMQDMLTEHSYHSVMRGETDLVFTPGMLTSREVKAKTLFTEDMVFLCSADSDYPEIVDLKDIRQEDEVLIEWSTDFTRWHRHMFGEERIFRYALAETGNLGLFLQQKKCWLLAPATVAENLVAQGGIEIRKTAFLLPQRVTNCMFREFEHENPLIRVFMECLLKTLAELEARGIVRLTR